MNSSSSSPAVHTSPEAPPQEKHVHSALLEVLHGLFEGKPITNCNDLNFAVGNQSVLKILTVLLKAKQSGKVTSEQIPGIILDLAKDFDVIASQLHALVEPLVAD